MTSAIIDPDLEQAVAELAPLERRIRQIEGMLLDSDITRYPELARMLAERSDLRETFRTRGERLNLDPRALQLVVREAEKARSKARGRQFVSLDRLTAIIAQAAEQARIERAELNADLIAAQERALAATHRASGLAKAVDYLEASRVVPA